MSKIIYLHGFASSPASRKARYFQQRFASLGIPVETPDLAAGDFENLTLSGQLEVIRSVAKGEPVQLIGSSLGGYLAAIYAAAHPETTRVVLLAPAFGFPGRWRDRLGDEAYEKWRSTGRMSVFHYGDQTDRQISFNLVTDGERYADNPNVTQPCLIFHGVHDDVVPVEASRSFAQGRPNVELHAVDSDHELGNVLDLMWERVRTFTQSGT